jgi:uncharacterized protein YbbC (DUF1343 family)|nr:DUF1343 domain-containing protein [Candidatus Krumholzibacteria bacterium]
MAQVKTGLDQLVAEDFARLEGLRVGLLVHPASVDGLMRHATDLLADSARTDVRALFGPQHGIMGQNQDNMIEWRGFTDARRGVPVHSLYGQHRQPTPEMLAGLDVLVIDLQDIGARYYTFIWTLWLCLEACAAAGVKVMVLDRPNPLGGLAREGNVLDLDYRSFVGLAAIPMRHGLTIGELATMFALEMEVPPDLEVVEMRGWRRAMTFDETGLPWILPSPNMPTLDTAFVYPGGCLLEGTNLSEGRGTTRPFEIFGAPFIEAAQLADCLDGWGFPGAVFRPLHFEPTFHKFAGQICGGVQVHVTDRAVFKPVAVYSAAIAAVAQVWDQDFAWKQPPYEYEEEKLPIDILAGGTSWRLAVEAGRSPWDMEKDWAQSLAEFATLTADFLRYE